MEILNETIGGVPVGTLIIGVEEAKRALQETRLPATSANDDRKGRLDLSRLSNETLARDLYISTQMQLRFPQLPSGCLPRRR
jgi:hypothetical protein